MITVDFESVRIDRIMTHFVGNPMRDGDLLLSNAYTEINEDSQIYLQKYFLSPFQPIDFYNFLPTGESLDVYTLAKRLFADANEMVEVSKDIARLLYEHSNNEKIKEGEVNVVLFNEVVFDDEIVNAIGIFKSETFEPFLQMNEIGKRYEIVHGSGIGLKSLDKGCLIFESDEEEGYYILTIDKSARSKSSMYWNNEFLRLKPSSDEFHYTKDVLNIAKDFLTKKVPKDLEIDKTETINMLNKTMDYFKTNTDFIQDDFEEIVFEDEAVRDSFRTYNSEYRSSHDLEIVPSFEINDQAVKKQNRAFKSVLKLDKNFHVYIHGDKSLIERGEEADGRKFYKIYYEEEN